MGIVGYLLPFFIIVTLVIFGAVLRGATSPGILRSLLLLILALAAWPFEKIRNLLRGRA